MQEVDRDVRDATEISFVPIRASNQKNQIVKEEDNKRQQ